MASRDSHFWQPPDYLEAHLLAWARWMREQDEVRGYPDRSPVLSNGGASVSFDDLCDEADGRVVCATDAAIQDLREISTAQYCAVHHEYLNAVWRWQRLNYEVVLEKALQNVAAGLRRRSIWLGE